jgi:predicted esterase
MLRLLRLQTLPRRAAPPLAALARRACGGVARIQELVDKRTAVFEPPAAHKSTVIILHGLGDTAMGWVDAAQFWQATMPNTKFVLPTAADMPVSLNFGMAMPAWYNLSGGGGSRDDELCKGIEESRAVIHEVLRREAETLASIHGDGSVADRRGRLALVGFSQGGALSLYAGLQARRNHVTTTSRHQHVNHRATTVLQSAATSLACIACLSGYLPRPRSDEVRAALAGGGHPPILMAHGEADPMVRNYHVASVCASTPHATHACAAPSYGCR